MRTLLLPALLSFCLACSSAMPGSSGSSTGTAGSTSSGSSSTSSSTSSASSSTSSGMTGHWPFDCPAGYLTNCSGPNVITTRCDVSGVEVFACSEAAGILTNQCPASCTSGLCAVTPPSLVTCCAPGSPSDPCLTSPEPCVTPGTHCLEGGVEGTCASPDFGCCTGCLDAMGACWHDFADNAHCGVNGGACAACAAPAVCMEGTCG